MNATPEQPAEQPAATNRGAAQLVSYEANALEAIAETYPAEMREPFFWLAEFIQDKCARNLETLEKKLRDLGMTTTSGTISKILRGRWRIDAKKNPVPPIMALDKFLEMVAKLQSSPEVSEMASDIPFIETSTYKLIEDYINVRRQPIAINVLVTRAALPQR